MADILNSYPGTGYNNVYLDSLIWGGKWIPDANDPPGVPVITYVFAQGTVDGYGVTGLAWTSETEKNAFRQAVQLYQNVANIQFQEVANYADADVAWYRVSDFALDGSLGQHEPPAVGFSEPLFGLFNVEDPSWADLSQGSFGFITIIHELGHAFGLAHPHDGGDRPDASVFPGVTSPFRDYGTFSLNQGIWTTMSYNDGWNLAPAPSRQYAYGFQGTPMALDIAALQALYGANTSFAVGDDAYLLPGVNGSGTFWSCIWDAGGEDEIDAGGTSKACTINLNDAPLVGANAGGFVSRAIGIIGGFTIANGAIIENATGGSGADTLTGNEFDNLLTGNLGNDSITGEFGDDTLDGGGGSDRLVGGFDDDLYWVDSAGDVVTELVGGGKDSVKSSVSQTLSAEVENLELIEGSTAANATGNALGNQLIGNSLGNVLDGKAGVDTMHGGAGDDTYIVDNINEALAAAGNLVELAGGGNDTVKTSVSINEDLAAEVENLVLTGNAAIGLGNAANNVITGTTAGNTLNGRGGNDSLSAGGGNDTLAGDVGDDTLDGGTGADEFNVIQNGAGNDLYIVDNVGDHIPPTTDDGIDTVRSTVTWTLGSGQENLELAGAGAINGTGNDQNNKITGNVAANILDGGGVTTDTLIGGGGNDTYIVDAFNEDVQEKDKEGTDLVKSSAAFFLLPAFVENLTLTGTGGVSGAGNSLNNVISGNDFDNQLSGDAGNDTINGGGMDGEDTLDGGTGNDSMAGGGGDDLYKVDSTGDKVTETSVTGGHDTIESAQSFTLGANLEDLKLLDDLANNINATGNTLDNLLIGNFKDNVLDGKTGADTMQGGQGNDSYVIDNVKDQAEDTFGIDTVVTPFTTDLGSTTDLLFGEFENLTLTGTSAVNGTGTDDVNVIIGNSGANKLFGLGQNDTITGAGGNDTMEGGGGADSLDGGAGADSLDGGDGNDSLTVDSAMDTVAGGADIDTIRSSITYSIALLADIENLTLIGTGALNATGNSGKNIVTGNDGANVLDGGAGDDTMNGGKGNDTFRVKDAGDIVADVDGGGIDTVLSDFGYVLNDPFIENLTLNAAAGIADATGNGLSNKLTGNDFNNRLDGKAGADTMAGGKGNDTYIVDDVKDVITEVADGNSNHVESTAASYTLATNIATLLLLGGAGNGTGNTLDNTVTGNGGANSLAGSSGNDELIGNGGSDTLDGGTGNDSLQGGEGDDLYIVDSAGDNFTESGSSLGDELKTNQALSAEESNIEHYTFTGSKAVNFVALGADNRITGTALADTIDGGDGDNTLSGGAGADRLTGGNGNDTYVVDNASDKLTDSNGTDTVQSSVTFDLTDDGISPTGTVFGAFENLTLTGTGTINGTGNDLDNEISGNSGANKLTGGGGGDTLSGGGGNDTIDGGAGNDTFRYTSKLDGKDVINNFDGNATGGQDVLNLDALFDSLGVASASRAGRLELLDKGSSVEIRVDTNGDATFDLFIATINTTDEITVGSDIIVGT